MARVDNSRELYSATFPSSKVKRKKIIDTIICEIPGSINLKNHELYLVIDEAVSNAMEHGNKWDPHKKITVTISTNGLNMNVTIEDEGKGFDPESIDKESGSIKPRGRGIHIMKHFCEMEWNEKGNIVNLIFKLQ